MQQQSHQQNNPSAFSIDAYDLVGLLEQVQAAVQQGYKIDLSTNENYPVQLGTRFCLTMVKKAPEALQARNELDATQGSPEVVETAVEAPTGLAEGSVETKGKPGRKKQG